MSTLEGGNAASTAGVEYLDGLFFSVDDAIRLPLITSALGVGTVVAQEATARVPKLTGKVTLGWTARDNDLPDADASFDAVEVTPKTVGAIVTIKRSALLYGLHPNVQSIIPAEMQAGMASALDQAVLYGAGTNEPDGIASVAQSGDPLTSLASGYSIAGALIDYQKSDAGLRWALANQTIGKLATTVAFSGSTMAALQGTTFAGYPFVMNAAARTDSNQDREYFIANWSYAHLVVWDSASLVANPYSGFKSGSLDVRIIADASVLVRDPARFYRGFADALS
jgi:HK97 family phage major capsid protein